MKKSLSSCPSSKERTSQNAGSTEIDKIAEAYWKAREQGGQQEDPEIIKQTADFYHQVAATLKKKK